MKTCLPLAFSIAFIFIYTYQVTAKVSAARSPKKLYFIENKGQIKDQFSNQRKDIQYELQGQGITIFIGDGQLHYQFANKNSCIQTSNAHANETVKEKQLLKKGAAAKERITDIATYRMDVELVGADRNAEVIAEDRQMYFENYFLQGCPADGITAYTWKKLTYKNILPDIDWVINIKGERLEHEFVVKPGGDVSKIKLRYSGQTSLIVDENDGSITATTPMGIIKEQAPICYKPGGTVVTSSFKLRKNVLTYDLDGYNGALVIDPVLEWGTYYGTDTSTTYFYDITCDDSANVYACGSTYSSDMGTIATTGSFQTIYSANEDGYLVKFDSSGNRIWGTYYGGSQIDVAEALTCDKYGNIYLAGFSASDSGISTPGTQEPVYVPCQWDGFLAKFNAGGQRKWGTYVGGTVGPYFDIEIASVICDALGHVYVSGACDDTTNISTPGSFKYIKTEGLNRYDCFLIQYDTSGIRQWGTYYGGNKDDISGAACTDGTFVYLSGWTLSDTGIATAGSYQPALYGAGTSTDAFIAKFDPAGNRLWGTYYGGEAGETTGGITISGNYIYLFGSTNSDTSMASPGCFQPLRGGGQDAFLAQFEPELGYRQWGTYYGGPGDENTNLSRFAIDDTGNVYVTGYTNSTAGIASPGAWKTSYGGGPEDAFIAKYNAAGMQQWSTYYGGDGEDRAEACAFDGNALYVCGLTSSTDSIATPGSFLSTGGGYTYYYQGFIAKFADLRPDPIFGTDTICAGSMTTLSDDVPDGTWSSSNSAIATIGSASGTVTGVAVGSATITYMLSSGTMAVVTITVNPLPLAISGNGSVCIGAATILSDLTTGGTWSSSNTAIATVGSATGSVSGISTGAVLITYTLSSGCYVTFPENVNCVAKVPVITNGKDMVTIFPNPAYSVLTISAIDKISSVIISNIFGQVVYTHVYNNEQVEVDISGLPNGAYFVKVNSNEVMQFEKK